MSYDRDPERYSVHPDDGDPPTTWVVIDEYYEMPVATFVSATGAMDHAQDLNDNYNEEQGMRAQERAFEAYWSSEQRHASDRPATREELIRDWDRD